MRYSKYETLHLPPYPLACTCLTILSVAFNLAQSGTKQPQLEFMKPFLWLLSGQHKAKVLRYGNIEMGDHSYAWERERERDGEGGRKRVRGREEQLQLWLVLAFTLIRGLLVQMTPLPSLFLPPLSPSHSCNPCRLPTDLASGFNCFTCHISHFPFHISTFYICGNCQRSLCAICPACGTMQGVKGGGVAGAGA